MSGLVSMRWGAGFIVGVVFAATTALAAERPNVLFLMSDDLTAALGCYDHAIAQTPNLDRLAKRGIVFERAYCQFPLCNPSRASILSGLRPNVTRVTANEDDLYKNIPGVVTLPRHFRNHGYATARCGKIFHLGVPSGQQSRDDPNAWDFGTPFRNEAPFPRGRRSPVTIEVARRAGFAWTETTGGDAELVDGMFARAAVEWLEKCDRSKPFFLAVGFHRPHLPFVAPAEYFDLYPIESITLPDAPENDEADIPLPARNGSIAGYTNNATPEQRKASIRAYLACISYMDAQAGYVLDALERLRLAENTIVVFVSDHGWHLGEHGLWHKRSLFEESARVPLILAAPGMATAGSKSKSLVELIDLYPTLCDLCGLPPEANLQGKSLRPLLTDPQASIHDAAFSEARRGADGDVWGRSVRTDRWRLTEWNFGNDGLELYDHQNDPYEYHNLANDDRYSEIVAELRVRLKTSETH